MGQCMSGTTEAFSRIKIDALPKDAGREFTDEVRSASNVRCRTVHGPITSSATGPGAPWRCLKPSVSALTPCVADQGNGG